MMRKRLGILMILVLMLTVGCAGKSETAVDSSVPQTTETSELQETSKSQEPPESLESPEPPPQTADSVTVAMPVSTPSPKSVGGLSGKLICIDAGHGVTQKNKQEKIAPNTSETKPAYASGTRGATLTEEQLNLKVAVKLEAKLQELGATVLMTRTTAQSDMSNIDRAEFANTAGVDIAIRIHADGNDSSSVYGMSVLIPTTKYLSAELVAKSKKAGEFVLAETVKTTGAKNRGISERSDMTGFNWSTVPVILLEMGFMTNLDEDRLLSTDDYQNKIVQGIIDGLVKYFE